MSTLRNQRLVPLKLLVAELAWELAPGEAVNLAVEGDLEMELYDGELWLDSESAIQVTRLTEDLEEGPLNWL